MKFEVTIILDYVPFVKLPPETLDMVVACLKIPNSYSLRNAPTESKAALPPPPTHITKDDRILLVTVQWKCNEGRGRGRRRREGKDEDER